MPAIRTGSAVPWAPCAPRQPAWVPAVRGKLVNRHRIVRRGIPYGDPLLPGADDGGERGLMFTCLQASISRQFEFIQSQWLGDGNVFGLGADQDVLLGTHDGPEPSKMTVPGRPPCFVGPLSRVVRTCGGEYFFAPGINGLHYLAALPEGRTERLLAFVMLANQLSISARGQPFARRSCRHSDARRPRRCRRCDRESSRRPAA